MSYDIVYESCPWYKRVSLFNEQKKLLNLHYEFENDVYKEGAVIIGRVRKIVSSLNAAFIDIGDVDDGFLSLKKIPKNIGKLFEGQAIIVRIIRSRVEGKGATLSANVLHSMPEDLSKIPYVLENPPSALSRALMDAGASPVKVWINDARFRVEVLEIVPETKVFQLDQHEDNILLEKLDDELTLISGENFPLAGGGNLTIESTKALTSIDVDSGKMQLPSKEELAFQVNMIATEEIVRLCKLLNIGGSVIVDFISMRSSARRVQVAAHIRDLFAESDLCKVEVLKMSRFGLLEFNREKIGATLLKNLKIPNVIAGDILLKLWRGKPGSKMYRVEAAKNITDILNSYLSDSVAIAYIGRPVEIITNVELKEDDYIISSTDIF